LVSTIAFHPTATSAIASDIAQAAPTNFAGGTLD
jgi:hypothetical protein